MSRRNSSSGQETFWPNHNKQAAESSLSGSREQLWIQISSVGAHKTVVSQHNWNTRITKQNFCSVVTLWRAARVGPCLQTALLERSGSGSLWGRAWPMLAWGGAALTCTTSRGSSKSRSGHRTWRLFWPRVRLAGFLNLYVMEAYVFRVIGNSP